MDLLLIILVQRKKARQQKSPVSRGKKGAANKGGKGKAGNGKALPKRRKATNQDNLFLKSRGWKDGVDRIGLMILDNLMRHDAIEERLNDPAFKVSHEPQIENQGKGRKETQLQKLYANIPEHSNMQDAKSDKAKLAKASRSFGYAQVKAVDGKWLVKGMHSTLYHHQLLGAQWMVSRELSLEPPHGGILADSMGLGKTVQTLACMVGNPPSATDIARNRKTTLIVVPSAVVGQWMEEIRTHVLESTFPRILHYKASFKIPIAYLQDSDIILTSYTEVMRQFPYPDQESRDRISGMGCKKWWKEARQKMGDLHKVTWYRVVLDEAHAIKNNTAQTSLACQNLKSVFRWCLTGTPLLNRLEE
jgi:SNF2 family DNA or RNA helicase